MTKEIILSNGKITVVDDDDYAHLSEWKWGYTKGYAARTSYENGHKATIYMHRQLMDTPIGMVTDHINGDRLDNRRKNLRICSNEQNLLNRGADKGSSSRFKGVYFRRNKQKHWHAQIRANKKSMHLGSFSTELEAARAYNEAAVRLHGEYAHINIIT